MKLLYAYLRKRESEKSKKKKNRARTRDVKYPHDIMWYYSAINKIIIIEKRNERVCWHVEIALGHGTVYYNTIRVIYYYYIGTRTPARHTTLSHWFYSCLRSSLPAAIFYILMYHVLQTVVQTYNTMFTTK